MNNQIGTERERAVRAVEAFLEGLVKSSVDGMPLISPLDPANPKRGREQASNFLNLIFPKIPVPAATVERHIVEGAYVATRWDATFRDAKGSDVLVSIFDFFRVTDGLIREARFFFDPKPLKDILKLT